MCGCNLVTASLNRRGPTPPLRQLGDVGGDPPGLRP